MLGELDKKQILDVLNEQLYGHLACHADDESYVLPINFIYRDNAIYAHSGEGKKIEMMRKNPKVCFQVSEINDNFKWKSVIIWGDFEELKDQERQQAMQGIIHKIMPQVDGAAIGISHGIEPEKHLNLVVYRININKATGRFESHDV